MDTASTTNTVDRHYGRPGLRDAVLEALAAAGKDLDALSVDDLAPLDQFHTRGRTATEELARLAAFAPGTRVLDVGGGVGGPARLLAQLYACDVTVLDLTEEYCRLGEELTARVGLPDRVRFQHGSALDIPFPPGSFDAAWTQHATMNIADKPRLFSELARVLPASGRLAMHEIVAGVTQPIHLPVPWARDASISALVPAAAFRDGVAAAGFHEVTWEDVTAPAFDWFRERVAAASTQGTPPLGVHVLLGDEASSMFRNLLRNLEDGRVQVIRGVWNRR